MFAMENPRAILGVFIGVSLFTFAASFLLKKETKDLQLD